jgi:drug/metabolite transporter (DMT)-like permease
MPIAAIILLVVSGLLHAVWNLWLKKAADPTLFFASALTAALALYTPGFWLWVAPAMTWTGPGLWPWAVLTGVTEGLYLVLLTYTYRRCDLSLVYPVSRGSAPLFILTGGFFLLGERVTATGYAGIALVVAGIVACAWPATGARASWSAVVWSLGVGAAIAAHTVGYKRLFVYWPPHGAIYVVWWLTAATLWLYCAWERSRPGNAGKPAVIPYMKAEGLKIAATGVIAMGGFCLALLALNLTLASYMGAARNVGIVFSVLFGAKVLREGGWWERLGGAAAVTAGVVVIALS